MSLHDEIFEQPDVLQNLLDSQWTQAETIANAIQARGINYIFLAARGTSDNAGLYTKYLWGSINRLPLALAAPSLFSLYQQPPKLTDALVLGISQSGQSPDIVSVIQEGRDQGNLTLAVVNDAHSPMAKIAELVFDISAGPEKAIAATKSYTTQLMSIAMISAALAGDSEMQQALQLVPKLVSQALALEPQIIHIAERYRYMEHCVVLGRGYNYATAYEWALKMKEMAYIIAESYSSADFLHGPIAVVRPGFPVMAVAMQGVVLNDTVNLLTKLQHEHQAELLVVSNDPTALSLAQTAIPLPGDIPEWLSPIIAIVVGQLFTYYLTQSKGFDVEAPRGLSKVTKTH